MHILGGNLMKRAPTLDIIWLFIATRLLLVLVTYIGFILFPVPPHVYPVSPVNITALLTSWNHWDAANFTRIAQYGYQTIYDTAFFPLFPLLVKCIAFLFGNNGYLAIGMFLSNLALLGSLFVLLEALSQSSRICSRAKPLGSTYHLALGRYFVLSTRIIADSTFWLFLRSSSSSRSCRHYQLHRIGNSRMAQVAHEL